MLSMLPSLPQTPIFLLHLAATLFMTGLIWFVQVVHYPLFGRVGTEDYAAYQSAHAQRTTLLVMPPMLLELLTAGLLAAHPPAYVAAWQAYLGLALVGGVWLSTFLLQVPRHNLLGGGYDPDAHRALVATNWLRTLAWSLRALLVLAMTAQALG